MMFDGYVPAVVFLNRHRNEPSIHVGCYLAALAYRINWNVYSSFDCNELNLVLVFTLGLGIVANRSPFLKISKLLTSALASVSAGHSNVTLVCVTWRSFKSGGAGESNPYSCKIESCRDQKSLS
jgi:hypothetical protein